MINAKLTSIFVCFAFLTVILFTGCAKAPEIREYTPNTVTCTLGVCVGTVDDVASIDAAYYQVTEEDVGADDTDTATEEWIVMGTASGGAFPGDMQTQDGTGVQYTEADDDGGAQDAWIFYVPDGVGTYTQWTPGMAGFNWQLVSDDPPHDADVSYVFTAGNAIVDSYTAEDLLVMPAGYDLDGNLFVFAWAKTVSPIGSGQGLENMVRTGAADHYGPVQLFLVQHVYQNISHEWAVNPTTSLDWTVAEINAVEIGMRSLNPVALTTRTTSVGMVVPLRVLNYALDVRHNVTGVPIGRENYLLTMRGLTNPGEDIAVYVYDHTTPAWDLMFSFTTNVYATETYALTGNHINIDNEVWVRSVDAGGDAVATDEYDIDLLNVRAWDVSYTLDFTFAWLGLESIGKSSILTVVGYRTGIETMSLSVMRTGAWFVLDATVLAPAPVASYVYDIAAVDVLAGTLQIRFTDNDPTDDGVSIIYLDFISLQLEEEQEPPDAPIDVYVDIEYDDWANRILVWVWWIQVGGPELAIEEGRWVTVETDGILLGTYEISDARLSIEAPWSYFDGDSHNITGVGTVSIYWGWLDMSQTYYSEPGQGYATNFPRLAVIMFFTLVTLAAAIAIIVRIAKGRYDEDD